MAVALHVKSLQGQLMRSQRRAPKRPPQFVHHVPDDDGDAFVPDVTRHAGAVRDDEAEASAEEFIASATGAEAVAEDARDELAIEEFGGPFLEVGVGVTYAPLFPPDEEGDETTETEETTATRDKR
jgi:hypothetical protein